MVFFHPGRSGGKGIALVGDLADGGLLAACSGGAEVVALPGPGHCHLAGCGHGCSQHANRRLFIRTQVGTIVEGLEQFLRLCVERGTCAYQEGQGQEGELGLGEG